MADRGGDEHELLEVLADALPAMGGRLATPEETQVLVDHAVTSVMAEEELLRATPLARTVDGPPEIPRGGVEVMWRAGYLAHEVVAAWLGVTGFQHSMASLTLLGKLRGIDGPYLIVKLEDALFPQYDLRARVDEALADSRGWLAEQATEKLAGDLSHVHPNVVAHWRALAASGGGDR